MKKVLFPGLLVLGLILIAGQTMAEIRTLTVTARTSEDSALPPGALLDLDLLDVSRADAPSIRLSSQRFRIGAMPFTGQLAYDSAVIDDRMSYVVAGRILQGDDVLYLTTTSYPVLTRGGGDSVEIVLDRAESGTDAAASGDETGLGSGIWTVTEIGGQVLNAQNPPTLIAEADGGIAIYGGCNRFRGQAEIADGAISFGQALAGTRMACPPERMRLERDMLGALQRSVAYTREGDVLSFFNDAGDATVRFRQMPQ